MRTHSFDMIRRVRGTHLSRDYEKVIPASWLPSVPEKMLPLFQVGWDKAGTALSLFGPISSETQTKIPQYTRLDWVCGHLLYYYVN
jgi:hypothetical protein